jgi:5'-nucleotidase/UDP-sugar diphosphatase
MKTLTRLILITIVILMSGLFSPGIGTGAEQSIRILHVNDFHGFVDGYKPSGAKETLGGAAVLAGKIDRLRAERPSLLVSAGDMIQGDNWTNQFQGGSTIELMNLLKFDVMTLGNHEFDFGQDILRRRMSEAAFPVLGANIEGLPGVKPYVILQCGGLRVGIIGIATEEIPITTHPHNVTGLKFLPVKTVTERYVQELRNRADLLVVLSHTGYDEDRALAKAVSGIDVIVGGHSHTRVDNPPVIGKTLVTQAGSYGMVLGVIDITMRDGKVEALSGRLEEIRADAPEKSAAAAGIVDKHKKALGAKMDEPVGDTTVALEADQIRKKETNLGNLITDIIKAATGAEIAVMNGGGIRKSLPKGKITVGDIYSIVPFDNYLVSMKLTGKQLRGAIEHGLSALEANAGRFLQVSGLSYTFDPAAPVGSRVREVTVAGSPVNPDRQYVVATIDFLAAGGDGFTTFGDTLRNSGGAVTASGVSGGAVVYSNAGTWLRDVVADYFRGEKTVSPGLEGRIRESK